MVTKAIFGPIVRALCTGYEKSLSGSSPLWKRVPRGVALALALILLVPLFYCCVQLEHGMREAARWFLRIVETQREVSGPPEQEAVQLHFSSLFLRECLAILTKSRDEELVLVSGVEVEEGVCVPSILLPLEYEYSSTAGVAARGESSHAQLLWLDENNHQLLAMLHSHPGTGPGAVSESHTDIDNQERFEQCGYRAITGIFSRDGHVRFFSNSISFRIHMHGSGITEVDDNVFRINRQERPIPLRATGT